MQFTLAFVVAAFATLAVATTGPTCSTGSIRCCQSVEAASSAQATQALGLVNVVVGDVTGLVGLQCTSVAGSAW